MLNLKNNLLASEDHPNEGKKDQNIKPVQNFNNVVGSTESILRYRSRIESNSIQKEHCYNNQYHIR